MDTAPTGNLLEANGTKIYHEVRGSGPSVLFIAGATGDGGHFERVGDLTDVHIRVLSLLWSLGTGAVARQRRQP